MSDNLKPTEISIVLEALQKMIRKELAGNGESKKYKQLMKCHSYVVSEIPTTNA